MHGPRTVFASDTDSKMQGVTLKRKGVKDRRDFGSNLSFSPLRVPQLYHATHKAKMRIHTQCKVETSRVWEVRKLASS